MVVWEEEVDHATIGAHISSWKWSSRGIHHRIRGKTLESMTSLVGRTVHVRNRAVGSVVPGIGAKCWVHVLQLVIGARGVLGRWGISHHRYVPPGGRKNFQTIFLKSFLTLGTVCAVSDPSIAEGPSAPLGSEGVEVDVQGEGLLWATLVVLLRQEELQQVVLDVS